jgi:MATE family multidrug resistance protein
MLLAGYSFLDPRLRALRLFAGPWRPHARELARLWRLGLPIGATIAAEVSVFSISALAMGLIGPDSIEAHSIVIQIAATAFMVPLGLGQAASVRVGHAFGARDRAGVARAGWTAFGMTMVFVAASAAVMFAAPRLLISAFIPIDLPANAAIVAIALSFTRVAAIFQVFDGGQAALANMLRGIHDSKQPMVMALTGYWAIGVPVSLALGFLTPLRGLGLWIGLAVGLAAVATMLLWRWLAKERVGFF